MGLSLDLRDELNSVESVPEAWHGLLIKLANLLGAREATFGGGTKWEKPTIFAPQTDPGYVGVYLQTYHQQNGFMQAMIRNSQGTVVAADAMPEFEAFRTSDFYNLWCTPQRFNHMFGFSIGAIGGWRGAMAINLSSAPSEEQMQTLGSLIPHVQRALNAQLLFAQLRSSQNATLSVLNLSGSGALFLDRHGRILEVNPIAEAMLGSGQLRVRASRLACPDPEGDRALQRLINLCLSLPDHSGGRVQISSAGSVLDVQCAPFSGSALFPTPQRPAAIVIITDPQQHLRQRLVEWQRVYGLTTAETELALAVVQTGSRKQAAELRNVTDATARAQLSSIFDKTGVRRQTDLVRLLMGGR